MKSKGFLLLFMVRYRNMLELGIIEVSIADGECNTSDNKVLHVR
jgi:hypothetical protein